MEFININDPVSGFITIPKKIVPIMDSKEVQRLRRIKQLSGAEYVFPGANHTRFEHSIGVMSNIQKLLDILQMKNNGNLKIEPEFYDSAIIAGLTHDLGHGPFSHNFEEILLNKTNKDHEDFTELIITKSEIGDKIESLGLSKQKVAKLARGNLNQNGKQYLDQMIAGAVDCDQMDYLVRDSYHCGTNTSSVLKQRLMTLADITPSNDLGFNVKGIATLESFLLERLNAFRTIYFHKTSRAIQLMIGRAINLFSEETDSFNFKTPEDYLKWDDIELYYQLVHNEKSSNIMKRIRCRDLIKCAYEKPSEIIKADEKPKTGNPEKITREIAEKAKISPEDVYIDFPMMTNVPYQHSASLKQNEIPIFSFDENGNKIRQKIEESSLFFEQIRGYYNLVRVYTEKKYKQTVNKAAIKVLVGITLDEFM